MTALKTGLTLANEVQLQPTPIPRELRAVLTIFETDEELRHKALPFVNIARQFIDWERIYQNDFGGGHLAALAWAKAIWCDEVSTKSDPFDRAFAMDGRLQVAVLNALAIRWGLREAVGKNPNFYQIDSGF